MRKGFTRPTVLALEKPPDPRCPAALPHTIYAGAMLRFVVYIALFAMVVYAGFWLLDRRKGGGRKKAAKPIPRGPVGPDDDEDFLRELERRRRHSKNGPSKDGPSKDGQAKNSPPKNGQAQNGKPPNGKPKDVQPKKTPPKAAPDEQPKDPEGPQAQDPQPKPQPKDAKPNDGEA